MRRLPRTWIWIGIAAVWLVAAATIVVAWLYRTPLLASVRREIFVLTIVGSLAVLAVGAVVGSRYELSRRAKAWFISGLGFVAIGLAASLWVDAGFRKTRAAVLAAPPDVLARVGRHVIVGYRDIGEVHRLIGARAIAGVFVTARNARGKTVAALAAEVAEFQRLRAMTGLPPLWIAADQEGGGVARLTPPLDNPGTIRSWLAGATSHDGPQQSVMQRAEAAGQALARVGVNLNFAPVVDLNFGVDDPADRFSRISARAISRDARVVSMAATAYCAGLARARVLCTLKHFPGLGRVSGDTHQIGRAHV